MGHGVYKHLEFGRLRAPSPAAIAHRQPAKRTSSAMVPIFKCDESVHAKMPLDTPFDAEWSCANVSKMSVAHLPRREKTAPMKVPGGTLKPAAAIVTSIGNDSLATGPSTNPRCNLIAVAIVVVRSNSNSASNQFFLHPVSAWVFRFWLPPLP